MNPTTMHPAPPLPEDLTGMSTGDDAAGAGGSQ